MTRYNATVKSYSIEYPPELSGGSTEYITYNLVGDQSNLQVMCTYLNNALTSADLYVNDGQAVYSKTYATQTETARSILEGYQQWTGDSSLQPIIIALESVDDTKATTTTAGNVTIKVISNGPTEKAFHCLYTVNGVEYPAIAIGFEGSNVHVSDSRSLFKIGGTEAKISKDAAVAIALKRAENFSYTVLMGDEPSVEIAGFNIVKSNITAQLGVETRDGSTLYPCWQVWLPLDHLYSGGVFAISVFVWADSGVVMSCTEVSGGSLGDDPTETSPAVSASPSTQLSTPLSTNPPLSELNLNLALGIIIAVIALAAAAMLVFKRRSK
jgi:hypothetical protein